MDGNQPHGGGVPQYGGEGPGITADDDGQVTTNYCQGYLTADATPDEAELGEDCSYAYQWARWSIIADDWVNMGTSDTQLVTIGCGYEIKYRVKVTQNCFNGEWYEDVCFSEKERTVPCDCNGSGSGLGGSGSGSGG